VLANWATGAKLDPARVQGLLTAFASEQAGKICAAGAPRCDDCEVRFCKRLRYR
jgi:hypothetical protein